MNKEVLKGLGKIVGYCCFIGINATFIYYGLHYIAEEHRQILDNVN